ncbi:MAG: phospholipase D family protein [Negativicutes bacterium]|nr:phospholipase D family protein [Negativicutes bacterium]
MRVAAWWLERCIPKIGEDGIGCRLEADPGIPATHKMKSRRFAFLRGLLLIVVAAIGITQFGERRGTVPCKNDPVYFSPNGGCTKAVVNALGAAKINVLVQAYSFTSAPIARALVDAHKRGVTVKVILDKSNRTEKYSAADFIAHAGIPTFIDDKHAIAHNKIMVIDGHNVVTGSFNFTKAAEEHNAENLLVIDDAALAASYTRNWEIHRQHSTLYQGR